MVLRQRKHVREVFNDTFLGSQLVDWLMVVESLTARDAAIALGNEMIAAKKIAHCQLDIKVVLDRLEPYVFLRDK